MLSIYELNIKKIIAYSSIVHMSYSLFAISCDNLAMRGIFSSIFAHGITSSMLFLMFGFIYKQRKSKNINDYSDLLNKIPKFSFFFIFASLSNGLEYLF